MSLKESIILVRIAVLVYLYLKNKLGVFVFGSQCNIYLIASFHYHILKKRKSNFALNLNPKPIAPVQMIQNRVLHVC